MKVVAKEANRSIRRIDIAPQLGVTLARTESQARRTFQASQLRHHLQSLRKSTLKDQTLSDFGANNLIGTPAQVIDRIGDYQDAGATHLARDIPAPPLPAAQRRRAWGGAPPGPEHRHLTTAT